MNLSPWYCPLCHAVLAWLRLMAPMARCVSFENSLMVSCRCERLEDGYWWKALGDFLRWFVQLLSWGLLRYVEICDSSILAVTDDVYSVSHRSSYRYVLSNTGEDSRKFMPTGGLYHAAWESRQTFATSMKHSRISSNSK